VTAYAIPHRPFACEQITGMMLPDGIFEASFGRLSLNLDVHNTSSQLAGGASIYIESVSDPGIVVSAYTFVLGALAPAAAQRLAWAVNVTAATPGSHRVSIVVNDNGIVQRFIKKIFVMRTTIDQSTNEWVATVPQGVMRLRFDRWLGPADPLCCCNKQERIDAPVFTAAPTETNPLALLASHIHQTDFEFCLKHYLPTHISSIVESTPPFDGQYGDLPFDDPWWKILLCIVALLLLIAAAIAGAVSGNDAGVTAGSTDPDNPNDCCGVRATGGGSSYIAAGLVAAAAAVATVAAASDVRDPWRRGQDQTPTQPGQLTNAEAVELHLSYSEPIALGRPFSVGADWKYERLTNAGTLAFGTRDANHNVHTLSRYDIHAADVVRMYRDELWTMPTTT
jgi:hypothetical protein